MGWKRGWHFIPGQLKKKKKKKNTTGVDNFKTMWAESQILLPPQTWSHSNASNHYVKFSDGGRRKKGLFVSQKRLYN